MPQVPIRDLLGAGGMNLDRSPNSLPPTVFSDVINTRYVRGRMERFGGSQIFAEAPAVPEIENARAGFGITRQGTEGILIVTDDSVFVTINGTSWLDVTPASGIADTDTWTLNQYGDVLWITSLATDPYLLLPGAVQMVPFDNWPATFQCQRMIAYKNILVAVGIEDSNTPVSGLVIWSDVVSPADIVQVNWDINDPTSLAGENVLPDRDGEIRDAGVLRDSVMVYTDATVWRMDLSSTTVGVTPTVFNFRKIFSDDGIYRNRCFVEAGGKHYVVGRFDFYETDGFNKRSISDNRFTEFLYSRIGNNDIIFVDHYQRPQEIVISFGVDTDQAAREALVYNYYYDCVSRWNFGDTGVYTFFFQGPDFGLNIPTFNDWTNEGVRFSDLNDTTFNDLFPQNRDLVPYLLGGQSFQDALLRTDVGGSFSSVTPSEMFIERRDMDLDEVFGGERPIKYISKFLPQIIGEGTLTIQFGGRNVLASQIVWQPERVYTIGQDYKFDLRISTRFPALRIRQAPADGTFAMDGFDLIVQAESLR